MAKTLRTSGDYTIKAGAGTAGTNDINLDSRLVRVKGNLVVDGVQTTVNSTTVQIDDPIFILARNNSGTDIRSDTCNGGMDDHCMSSGAQPQWQRWQGQRVQQHLHTEHRTHNTRHSTQEESNCRCLPL